MPSFDYGLVICLLLAGIIWELDKIRQHTDTLRQIAWKEHFGEPVND